MSVVRSAFTLSTVTGSSTVRPCEIALLKPRGIVMMSTISPDLILSCASRSVIGLSRNEWCADSRCATNERASGPRSLSISAVGAYAPVSPKRLTSTRNVIASTKTRPTSTRERLNCWSSARAAARCARSPSPTRLLHERLEDLDHVRRANPDARHVVALESSARHGLRRDAVRHVHGETDVVLLDAEDAGQAGDPLGDGRDRAVGAVDLDTSPCAREQVGR